MDHRKLFSDKSDLYESARPTYPDGVFNYLASLCESTNAAWDCACGNGQAAISLANSFNAVNATDVSAEQISNAKQHPNISYSVSASEKTEFEDNAFDLVCVAQALHWFDYDLYWPEVKRVLKPGGVFTALGYNLPSINPQIDQLIQTQILDLIEPYWAPQNQLIWNRYQDLEIPFNKVDAPEFEMFVEWNLDELFNLIHTFSATRRCMDKIGDDFFQQAYSEVSKVWGDKQQKKKIDFEFVLYVGINEAL